VILEFAKSNFTGGWLRRKPVFLLTAKLTVTDEEYDLFTEKKLWRHIILRGKEFNLKHDTKLKKLAEGARYSAEDLPPLALIQQAIESRIQQLKEYTLGTSNDFHAV
jgi:hypothetical protein